MIKHYLMYFGYFMRLGGAQDTAFLRGIILVIAALIIVAAWIGGGHPVTILWFLSRM